METGHREQAWAEAEHRAVRPGSSAFPVSAAFPSSQTEALPLHSALSRKGSQKWLLLEGGTGPLTSVLPPEGRPVGVPKRAWDAPSASTPCVGAPCEELLGGGSKVPHELPPAAWLGASMVHSQAAD